MVSRGKSLLFSATKGSIVSSWVLSLQDRKATEFGGIRSTRPINASFSPDGRWVAYQSTETGSAMQIFVQPFPATGAKYQISKTANSSIYPMWSRDGKDLFYIPGAELFGVVSVETKPVFGFGNFTSLPRSVFVEGGPASARNFDVARDGRMLAVIPAGQTESGVARPTQLQLQIVLNWFEDVKQRGR